MYRRQFMTSAGAAALALPPVGGLLLATPALAKSRSVFAVAGAAMGGTDPVAYFAEGGPVRGEDQHMLKWAGAMWFFASDANRQAFEMNPRAYAPRYGGYCADAMTRGELVATIPEAWTIHDGRLYLNESLAVRTHWRRDIPGNIARADAHWPAVLH